MLLDPKFKAPPLLYQKKKKIELIFFSIFNINKQFTKALFKKKDDEEIKKFLHPEFALIAPPLAFFEKN